MEGDTEHPAKVPKLSVQRPGQKVEEYTLSKTPVLVGRVKTNDIVILGDSAISREHCRFDRDAESGEFAVRDLGSSNGTFVNGESAGAASKPVKAGDKIQVGGTIMIYLVDRPSAEAVRIEQKMRKGPMDPVSDEEKKVVFRDGFCTCGRCGATFGVSGKGPGEKVGCTRCRAVWTIPVIKPMS